MPYYPVTDATAQGTLHPALHNDVIDLEREYGLVVGGTTSPNRIANANALNTAFSDHIGGNKRLRLPPGVVEIEGAPVGIDVTGDTAANMEIFGHGRRSSRIHQRTDGQPTMRFRTTSGNLRDLYVHDFMLKGDSVVTDFNLHLSKCGYSTFNRLCLWTGAGVQIESAAFDLHLNDLWFLNISGYAIDANSSTAIFSNCTFGEACGSIISTDGYLLIMNSYLRDMYELVTPGGINGMGESMFSSRGDGYLTVENCNISMSDHFDNLCNIDNGIARFRNNDIKVGEGTSRLFCIRLFTAPQWLQFLGNSVELADAAAPASLAVVDQFISTEPHDSIIANNVFMCGTNWSLTNEDTYYEPANNNVWSNNIVRNTTGVT